MDDNDRHEDADLFFKMIEDEFLKIDQKHIPLGDLIRITASHSDMPLEKFEIVMRAFLELLIKGNLEEGLIDEEMAFTLITKLDDLDNVVINAIKNLATGKYEFEYLFKE
ncbi:MAG: hypothetical protein PHO12_06755 [Bacteroidales bacterium]|nr:hypothetical protein [Bacteroidales bacterium]